MSANNEEFAIDIRLDKDKFIASIDSVLASISKLEHGFDRLVETSTQSNEEVKEKLSKVNEELHKGSQEVEKSSKSSAEGFSKLKNEILSLVGVTVSLGAIVTGIKNLSGGLRELGIEAKAIGVTARELDGVQRIFDRYGSTKEEATSLLSRIAGTKSQLAAGFDLDDFGKQLQVFGTLSGSPIDIIGESDPVVILQQIAQAMQSASPDARLAFSNKLGLSSGALNTLTQKDFKSELELAIESSKATDEAIEANNRFVEALKRAKESLLSIGQTIMRHILPYLIQLNNWLDKWAQWFEDNPDKIAGFFNVLFDGSTSLVDKLTQLAGMFGDVETVIAALVAVVVGSAFVSVLGGAVKLLTSIAAMTFNPAILAALSALGGYGLGEYLRGTETGQKVQGAMTDALEWAYGLDEDGGNLTPAVDLVRTRSEQMGGVHNHVMGSIQGFLNDHASEVAQSQQRLSEINAPVGNVSVDWSQVRTTNSNMSRSERSAVSSHNQELLRDYIFMLEDKHGLPRGFYFNQIKTESAFLPDAVSPAGARGLAQFMPATGAEWGLEGDGFFDPKKSLDAGAAYMQQLMGWAGGDTRKALMGYNWGMGNYRSGDPVPSETRKYIDLVQPFGGHNAVDLQTSRMLNTPYVPSSSTSTTTSTSSTQSTVVNGNIILNNPSATTVSGVVSDGVRQGATIASFGGSILR